MRGLIGRLERDGVELDPRNGSSTCRLLGMARVTHRGATLDGGGLTVWPEEGRVLRTERDNPADGVLLKVSEVAELQEPIVVLMRRARGSDDNRRARGVMDRVVPLGSGKKQGKLEEEGLFWPVLPDPVDVLALPLRGGRSVADVLNEWGDAGRHVFFCLLFVLSKHPSGHVEDSLAQFIPRPFGALLLRGLFTSTLMLGRYRNITQIFPGTAFPPTDWLEAARPVHMQPPRVRLEARPLLEAVGLIRQLARHAPDPSAAESVVDYLVGAAATVGGYAQLTRRQQAKHEIQTALLMTHVKGQKAAASAIRLTMMEAMPGHADDLNFRSEHKVSNDQRRLDMAYMVLMRDSNHAQRFVRFFWADSSPQGGLDFMIVKEKKVKVVDLVRIADAVRLLQTTRGGSLGPKDDGDDIDDELGQPLRLPSREAANRVLLEGVITHLYVLCFCLLARVVCARVWVCVCCVSFPESVKANKNI